MPAFHQDRTGLWRGYFFHVILIRLNLVSTGDCVCGAECGPTTATATGGGGGGGGVCYVCISK
jgi:hypothetical protein